MQNTHGGGEAQSQAALAVSLNAGVCVGEGGASSGVREIPGLLRQSQAQSAALHISSCTQLTERERQQRALPSRSHRQLQTHRTCFSHLQHPPFFPATPSQREKKRERERKKKEKGVRKILEFESFRGGNTLQTQLIKHQTDRFSTLRFNPEVRFWGKRQARGEMTPRFIHWGRG